MLIDGCRKAVVLSTQNMQFRSVQEPSGEGTSAAHGKVFCDLLRINVSLVRRLVRTGSLTIKIFPAAGAPAPKWPCCTTERLQAGIVEAIEQKLQAVDLPVLLTAGILRPISSGAASASFRR